MFPHVVHRYAAITMMQPQNRYVLIAFSPPLTSTPMFSGVSMPRSARMANEKNVKFHGTPRAAFPRSFVLNGFHSVAANEFAEGFPFSSQTTPARPIRKIA